MSVLNMFPSTPCVGGDRQDGLANASAPSLHPTAPTVGDPGQAAPYEGTTMHILPERPDTLPPPVPIGAYSRVDGCPECVLNVEPPYAVEASTDGYVAAYLCSDCGHAWMTT